jgi:hypothetical protein
VIDENVNQTAEPSAKRTLLRLQLTTINKQPRKNNMKSLKLLMAGLLGLCSTGIVRAQTVIHITGSTAFRNATVTAITHILKPGFTYGYAGTSFTGANQHIFTGTTISNNIPVIIKTSWSGAVGGMQTVSQQLPISTWLTNTTPQSTTGTPSAPAVYDPPAVPDVGMDDGVQATTPFPTPALLAQNVGAVCFKWVRNVGSPLTLTNMTPFLAQALWQNGSLPLALFTGLNSDETTLVFALGRDPDSGTRKTAFAESGIGVFNTVIQYAPTNSSGNIVDRNNAGPITGQKPWPAETVNGIFFDIGNGGYSSGGDVAAALKTSGSLAGVGGYYLSYLGLSDANTAIAGGASEMTWNGIPFSDAAVQEGHYTFWAYEQLCYRNNYGTVDANGKTVADLLATQIKTVDGALAGELLSTMHCTRAVEGGVVTPNY